MNWLFWKNPRCPLCDSSFKKNTGAEIWLKHVDGIKNLNICAVCAGVLQAKKEGLDNIDQLNIHDPLKHDEKI